MDNYYVEIVKHGVVEEVVKRMGPMREVRAIRTASATDINLNHKEYFTRIVEATHED